MAVLPFTTVTISRNLVDRNTCKSHQYYDLIDNDSLVSQHTASCSGVSFHYQPIDVLVICLVPLPSALRRAGSNWKLAIKNCHTKFQFENKSWLKGFSKAMLHEFFEMSNIPVSDTMTLCWISSYIYIYCFAIDKIVLYGFFIEDLSLTENQHTFYSVI